jgi:FtsZ-interacting cell division protein YlmF
MEVRMRRNFDDNNRLFNDDKFPRRVPYNNEPPIRNFDNSFMPYDRPQMGVDRIETSDRIPVIENTYDRFDRNNESDRQYNFTVSTPKTFKDVELLIDNLKNREPLIIDLQGVPADFAQRVPDFMSGAVYAINGSMKNFKENLYLMTPSGGNIKKMEPEGKKKRRI